MIAAIVPAAGKSSRMGRPKPLISIDGRSMIHRVVEELRSGGVDTVVVVVPPADRTESAEIVAEVERAGGVALVLDSETDEMRATIQAGLDRVERLGQPSVVLLCPADLPGIHRDLVERLLRESERRPEAIIVPTAGSKRGHPVAIPWSLALGIRTLPVGKGVNALLDDPIARVHVMAAESDSFLDLDTPEDFRRWTGRDLA